MNGGERLCNTDRAALLRAARAELIKLKDQYDRLTMMAVDPSSSAGADSASLEIACLQRGIAWLWRDQLADDE